MKTVRIGGGQGFWGDSPDAAIHMIEEGAVNYLACDYLAELTLSIMARQKRRNPSAGYARDFTELIKTSGKEANEQNIRIITNAGGMNVTGCVNKVAEIAKEQKIDNYKIGYVVGDDLTDKLPELIDQGYEFKNIDNGKSITEIKDKIVNVNVYYGHEKIEECLELGADVVINGRAADSALFLAPLKHEFKWDNDDWDNLSKGIMAGHLLECGGQGSGGNYDYDWRNVPDMDRLGFPIAELTEDEFFITKQESAGGIITEQSCKEQFLYEVHDPSNYITPDVNVDLSSSTISEVAKDKVKIDHLKGKTRPDDLKLCVGYLAGYKTVNHLCFSWPDAYEKAQFAADIIMKKMNRKKLKAEDIRIDYMGLNSLQLDIAELSDDMIKNLNEVVLRIAIRTDTKEEAQKIIPEIAPLQLNGPPGATFFGGRAKVQEVIGLWPTFIPREAVELEAKILEVNINE